MIKAVRIHQTGGPEVIQWERIALPDPEPGQIQVHHRAIGLNFIDTYYRSGLYPTNLPSGLGVEAAGIVEKVGAGVTHLRVGDRIAYATGIGAYAEAVNTPAEHAVKIPDGITDEQAAACLLKGMTVHFLIHSTYPLKEGETILLHAAAGGVGLLFCQWATAIGATVIGTVGTPEKAEQALARGCAHTILYRETDVATEVHRLTHNKGVPAVFDAVGKDTLDVSLDCLSPRGLLVAFGNASGPPAPITLSNLMMKGSLYVTRPSLSAYTRTREEFLWRANAVFDAVTSGVITVDIGQRYPLSEVVDAHLDLEARKTTGATILIP